MKLSTQILLTFCLVLLLSLLDTGSNYLLSLKVEKYTEFRDKSQEVIRNSGALQKSMIAMQSSVRGFLLTRDTSFLAEYIESLARIPRDMASLKKLVASNPLQLEYLDSIQFAHRQWIVYADSLIMATKPARPGIADELIYRQLFETKFKKGYGQNLMRRVMQQFGLFDSLEYDTRSLYGKKLQASIDHTHTFSLMFFGLTLVVGIAGTLFIGSLISRRIKMMVTLAENISQGNFTKIEDNRKDEMTGLSSSLNIMSDKLDHNIRELENRNAELDKFAYVVSHDLKAPLRGIHNAINWIQEDHGKEITPELQKYLGIIPQRLQRMENLINGILDYARTRDKAASEKIVVKEMVAEIAEAIVPPAFEVQINDLPVIVTERIKLEQVFTNLLSNAVRYAASPSGKIIISAREFPGHYEFSVKDNGIGIDPEYHEKVFEIFQTLREKNETESTGIGLSIVKKILDDRNGSIRIDSALGRGAEFIFCWPKTNI